MVFTQPAETHPWLNTLLSARIAGVAVFLVLLVAVEVVFDYQRAETAAVRHSDAVAFGSNLRAQAERELNAVLFLSNGLAAYLTVRHDRIDQTEIHAVLTELYRNSRNIRNFALAEGYVVSHVHPLIGNEKVLGFDYSKSAAQWPDVKRTIDSRRGTLVGPVRLAQGGTGLIYRYPVFAKGKYWGMLSTVIDVDSFLRTAFEEAGNTRYEFAVASREGGIGAPAVFWGNPAILNSPESTLIDADIPNGKWVFGVRSKETTLDALYSVTLRIVSWTIAALLGLALFLLMKNRIALAQLALFDSLTGLPNRRLLEDRIHQAVSRHARRESSRCGLLFVDLDKFKAVNDQHGHKAGDTVLKTVSQRIRDEIRAGDTVARWGGDELVVLVEETDAAQIDQLVVRLREVVTSPILYGSQSLRVGASIGVAIFPEDAKSATQLLKIADQRMYVEKQGQETQAA